MVSAPSQCLYCARRRQPSGPKLTTQTCSAFPAGIPTSIWGNAVDHRDPIDGDGGLRWKPIVKGDDFPEWAMPG